MSRCLLALGANLGDRTRTLDRVLEDVSAIAGVELLARSTWHETRPAGGPPGQRNFVNGAVLLETVRSPEDLAGKLDEIETKLGRVRKVRWDARTVDIDILLYEGVTVETAQLQIPHPRMSVRQFVLAPAAEIAGGMVHPISGWTVAALWRHWCTAPRRVAIVGSDAAASQWIRNAISQEFEPEVRDRDDPRQIEFVSVNQEPSMLIDLDREPMGHNRPLGPVVRIEAESPDSVLQEALAAIHAAWPD